MSGFPSRTVAIAGIGLVGPGTFGDLFPMDLYVQAAVKAIDDSGIDRAEIDGLITVGSVVEESARDRHRHHIRLMEQLGLRNLTYTDTCKLGGSAVGESLRLASLYIQAGVLKNVLIAGADAVRGTGRKSILPSASAIHDHELELPFGPSIISFMALSATRYMWRYGLKEEQLAEVAVNARKWAMLNPESRYKSELTVEDVLSSRMISSPLRLYDCGVVLDGGGALLVTSAERAESGPQPPVYVAGVGSCYSHYYLADYADLHESLADVKEQAASRAYESAGMGPNDISIAFPHDGFSIMLPWNLEGMGFAKRGESLAMVAEGRCAPGGDLPVNPHGGGLNRNPPGFAGQFFSAAEAVIQLRGAAGERQVENAVTTMSLAASGVTGVAGSYILTNEA